MPYNWEQGIKVLINGEPAEYVDADGDLIVLPPEETSGDAAGTGGSDQNDGNEEPPAGRDYMLFTDPAGYFRTKVPNTEVGYLQIVKHVTYNHSAPQTAEQMQLLAGDYAFKITLDQAGQIPYQEDGTDLTFTITILPDGQAVPSPVMELPVGDYYVHEISTGNPAVFPANDNPLKVTVRAGTTTRNPQEEAFTNNYDKNELPDRIAIDIKKKFTGFTSPGHIPSDFKVILTYKLPGVTPDPVIELTKDQLYHDPVSGISVRFTSNGSDEWYWHITGLSAEATDFKIREDNYEDPDGYDWTGTLLDGDDYPEESPSVYTDLTITAPKATLTDVTRLRELERITPDNNKHFKLLETDVILISLTGHGNDQAYAGYNTLVVSKHSLNLRERDAISKAVPLPQGSFHQKCLFFSIEEHPDGFYFKGHELSFTTGSDSNGEFDIVNIFHKQSSQEAVFAVTYGDENDFNNANLENIYEQVPVDIEVIKIDSENEDLKLTGAEFTVRQFLDEVPTEGGTLTYVLGADNKPKTWTTTEIAGKTGFYLIEGLTNGFYEMTETRSPSGYICEEDLKIYFKVDAGQVTYLQRPDPPAGGTGGSDPEPDPEDNPLLPSNWPEMPGGGKIGFTPAVEAVEADPVNGTEESPGSNAAFTVPNTPGKPLPHTGGTGTGLIFLLGIMLTGLAVSGLLMKRRGTAA